MAEHVESIACNLDTVLVQLLSQEVRHDSAATPARLGVVTIECLRMSGLQQIVKSGAVRVREADKVPHGIHSWGARKVSIGTLLAKVPFLCSDLLARIWVVILLCEVDCCLALLALLAKHKR